MSSTENKTEEKIAFEVQQPDRRIGKAPSRSDMRSLMLSNYMKVTAAEPPKATNFWKGKTAIPLNPFGNMEYGDCTRASQANGALRMERIEQRKTIVIPEEEVVRVYFEMTKKYYGGGDSGAYEIDALNEWRRPDTTFKDSKGRPLTIDAYVRINQANIKEVKNAMWTAKAHGIKVCMNLPLAFSEGTTWDIPEGQKLTGKYAVGSWGGHSMFAEDYDQFGVIIPTWDTKVKVSWKAFATYADEAYLVIDSINNWKKRLTSKELNLSAIKADVNSVSSQKVK